MLQNKLSDNKLRVENISKTYKHRKVVDGVSFAVDSSEIVGLLGPNGAGKTSSFYMVLGLVTTESGKIFFNSQDITGMPVHARAKLGIGYLPQEPSVFRKLTVAENILGVLELRPELTEAERKVKLEALLQEFNINHVRDTMGASVSGGERRRVEIARALAMEPYFIFLDEPFAGIDPISIIDIKNIIKHLTTRGIGVIITDHNVRETLDICDKAYILSQGKVIFEGNANAIINNAEVKKIYLGEDFSL
jgi:lipopolysaccharide export system ATP-binding protein